MTDLDTLRPEVQQALAWLKSGVRPGTRSFDGWSVIRAELLRLGGIETSLRDIIGKLQEIIYRWLPDVRDCDEPWNEQAADDAYGLMCYAGEDQPKYGDQILNRAQKAEAELAALKARIAEAQECGVVALCGGGASLSHEPYPSLVGKRVRLVVDDEPTGEHADSIEEWARRKVEE